MSNKTKKLHKHICEYCGKKYENHYKHSRFCSRVCTNKWLGPQRREMSKCKQCGKEFYSASRNLFCSSECKKQWKLDKEQERKSKPKLYKEYNHICEECGREFISHNKRARFCSQSCASTHNNRDKIKYRKCKYCGKPFHKSNMWGLKFCSDGCRNKYNEIKRNKIREIKTQKWIEKHNVKCKVCGNEFFTKNLNNMFCSDDCRRVFYRDYQNKRNNRLYKKKIIECKNCGTVFETEYGNKRSVFCCKECRKHYSQTNSKKSNKGKIKKLIYNKKREKQIQDNFIENVNYDELYQRDNGVCQVCGLPVLDKGVSDYWSGSIDHIVPLSLGGEHSMSNCQLTHRICNSLKLQAQDEYKINW